MVYSTLDLLDRRILFELDRDAGVSSSKIGKKLRRSAQVVNYRIQKLESEGIVKNFISFVDYKKLGFTYHHINFRLQNLTEKSEATLFKHLAKMPNIGILLRCVGAWDLNVGVLAKDVFELNEIVDDIESRFGKYLKDNSKSTHIGAYRLVRNYLVPAEYQRPPEKISLVGVKREPLHLDQEDYSLLSFLSTNARASSTDIARTLGMGLDSVRYRLKKLRSLKVILGSTIILNHEKLDLVFYRLHLRLKSMSREKEECLTAFLINNPNVVQFIKAFGSYELAIDFEVSNPREFRLFLMKLRNRFADEIKDYEQLQVYSVDKFQFLPSLDIGTARI